MPIQRCVKNGKNGWKSWINGVCFIGPNAKQKAMEQLAAIKISQQKENE